MSRTNSRDQIAANCVTLLIDLQGYHIYKTLAWLNELPADEAEYEFRECCGSAVWARLMAEARPFPMLDQLFARAEEIWTSLPPAEKAAAMPGDSTMSDGDKWLVIETRLAKMLER